MADRDGRSRRRARSAPAIAVLADRPVGDGAAPVATDAVERDAWWSDRGAPRSPALDPADRRRDRDRQGAATAGRRRAHRRRRRGRTSSPRTTGRRGGAAAAPPRSDARCTRSCRRSTSPPAPASRARPGRRRWPRASPIARSRSRRWPGASSRHRWSGPRPRAGRGGRSRSRPRSTAPRSRGSSTCSSRSTASSWSSTTRRTAARTDAEIDAAVARYEPQGAAYALALELLLGRAVARCVFVFARSRGPAVERDTTDLAARVAEIRRAFTAPPTEVEPLSRS